MIIESADWGESDRFEADLCIVGGGAAGITLARELEGSGRSVILLESGGQAFQREVQQLYLGENVGRATHSTYVSRVRVLGGSTSRWSGMCRPLEPSDFERRSWIPDSGWPFPREELDPFYRRAHALCGLGPYEYDPASWATTERPRFPLDPGLTREEVYQFAHPLHFGEVYGETLAASREVTVHLRATVVEMELDADRRRIASLRVVGMGEREARVLAGQFVLASGGLENARLLLASNRQLSAGLGNQHDVVGRYFMDHVFAFTGTLDPAPGIALRSLHTVEDYDRMGREARALAALALPEEVVEREGLARCAVFLVLRPGHKTTPAFFSEGRRALNALADRIRGTDVPDLGAWSALGSVLRDLPGAARSFLEQGMDRARPRPGLALRMMAETTPNPASRVTLGPSRDPHGVPRIRVDWRPNPDDSRTVRRTLDALRMAFEQAGVGRIVNELPLDGEGWPTAATGGMHHMGTTRMNRDPRKGVVNADGRVHGLENLYIAGSSVFPTGGVVNPTLTLVALAIRLADHLRSLPARDGTIA